MPDYEITTADAVRRGDTLLWPYFRWQELIQVVEVCDEYDVIDIWYKRPDNNNPYWFRLECDQLILRLNNPSFTVRRVHSNTLQGNETVFFNSRVVSLPTSTLKLPSNVWVLEDKTRLYCPTDTEFVF